MSEIERLVKQQEKDKHLVCCDCGKTGQDIYDTYKDWSLDHRRINIRSHFKITRQRETYCLDCHRAKIVCEGIERRRKR